MRIRTLPVFLAFALFIPLAACAPQDAQDQVDEDTAEAAETGMEIQEEPIFGAQEMSCDDVAAYLESEGITESTTAPVEIVVEGGRAIAQPATAVVDTGGQLQWIGEDVRWVVEFKDGLAPFADGHMRDRGTTPGTPHPPEDQGRVGSSCGHFVYLVAASRGDSVFISDPHVWVK
jgi:hypothetical protein